MTIEEIKGEYAREIGTARAKCVKRLNEFLADNHLDGLVERKSDGKIGWIDIDYDLFFHFYPKKKNGERSLKSGGYIPQRSLIEMFEPYEENTDE